MSLIKYITICLSVGVLGSCSVATLRPEAVHVAIAAEPFKLDNCRYIGEVTGSEGHWYSYLFLSNRTLVQSAVYDLRNRTAALGGDTVYIQENNTFIVSVTLLGLVYRCNK